MKARFYTLDVFTDQTFGGNPLAVFPEADGLTDRQMQLIAREFNYSETVFVCASDRSDCMNKLRIFTPQTEVPFAGHPTVGAAFLLAHIGAIYLESGETKVAFEEKVGAVSVKIQAVQGKPKFTQLCTAIAPEEVEESIAIERIAEVLSLNMDEFSDTLAPSVMSCGLPFLLVPLKNRQAVSKAQLNLFAWQKYLKECAGSCVHIFAMDAILPSSHIHSRVFAPGFGVMEDPATGSAACALAAYLARQDSKESGRLKWIIEQGFEINRPSFLEIEVLKNAGQVTDVFVGGASVIVSEGLMNVI